MVFVKVVSCLIAVISVVILSRPLLSEYTLSKAAPDEESLLRASRITPGEARYHEMAGLRLQNAPDGSGNEPAIGRYLESLERDPTESRVWLALAKAYQGSGQGGNTQFALRKAIMLDRNNAELIWECGVFSLREGYVSFASRLFRRYIFMVPQEQETVYALFYSMKADPQVILDNLIPNDYRFYQRYLAFVMRNGFRNEASEVWSRMKSFGTEKKDSIGYINFLIEQGETGKARELWEELLKKTSPEVLQQRSSMMYNGDFETAVENGGFDWRLGKAEGVKIFRDRDIRKTGDASLSAHFDGGHNPQVTLAYQIVPVEGGRTYRFSGSIKTEQITTTNGIFFEITGHRCEQLTKRTEPLTGSRLWQRMVVDFTTPKECTTVKVAVKRDRSEKFDNKIGGDVWIDGISLEPLTNS